MNVDVLKDRWTRLAERIDRMSLRERGLLFVASLAVLYFVTIGLVWKPIESQSRQYKLTLQSKQQQVGDLRKELEASGVGYTGSPGKRIGELEQRIREIDSAMSGATSGLISPQEMARLVEDMLRKYGKLELVGMKSLRPVSMVGDSKDLSAPAPGTAAVEDALIYRHGLEIRLRGRYVDIVEYLRRLEGMKWKVFWGEVGLSSHEHPVSELTLVFYTLSFDKGWIGT